MAFNNRYDPTTFNDLIFADSVTATQLRFAAEGKTYNHLILHGPYGTGKSQTARIIAQNSLSSQGQAKLIIIEPDCEPSEAVEALHSAFKNSFMQMFGDITRPYAVINEIDRYPGLAQVRIRGIMDSMDNMRSGKLIMTTNNLHKVDPGIRDRCIKHELLMPQRDLFLPLMKRICKLEGVSGSDRVLLKLLNSAASIRGALDNLEQAINMSHQQRRAA